MSFKIKALVVAAVAAMALSGQASAIQNNELFLVAYNSAASTSFIMALDGLSNAPSVSGFTGTDSSTNLASGATASNWASFAASTGFNASVAGVANVQYQVLGFNDSGTASTILTTANPALTSAGNNNDFFNVYADLTGGGLNLWLTNYNAGVTGAGSSAIVSGGGTTNGSAAQIGTSWNNLLPSVQTVGALGANINFYTLGLGGDGSDPLVAMSTTETAKVWNLSSAGVLSYSTVSAVPEADTSGMMIIGLGLMGFVARRRSNNKNV